MKMNNLTISIRRHAKTNKSGKEASSPQRVVSSEGRTLAFELGMNLKSERIIGAYTSPPLRSQQTSVYLMDGAGQLDLEKMFVEESLDEPVISSEYRQIINAEGRKRDERFTFFLENQDPTARSTTLYEAACGASYFIAAVCKMHSDNLGRVEAITNAPKLECFLQTLEKDAFVKHLEGKSFDYLEGIELKRHNSLYIIHFREKEMQVQGSKVIELANSYTSSRESRK